MRKYAVSNWCLNKKVTKNAKVYISFGKYTKLWYWEQNMQKYAVSYHINAKMLYIL